MIRKMKNIDINRAADIWLKTNLKAHYFIPEQYWTSNYELVKEMMLQAEVYVYEDGKMIQGFVGLSNEYIEGIFVSDEMQSCGIGKFLLDYIKNKKVRLRLNVYQKNTRALSFYQREGFEGAAIVNISSSRDRMSQPQTESYTAAKGGISALTHALAVSLAGRVRVNSISPGWIDTDFTEYTGADAVQQPVHRVGNPMDIANMVLFLCSEKAGFITGENICIDGGMTKQMIYHGDCGWRFDI